VTLLLSKPLDSIFLPISKEERQANIREEVVQLNSTETNKFYREIKTQLYKVLQCCLCTIRCWTPTIGSTDPPRPLYTPPDSQFMNSSSRPPLSHLLSSFKTIRQELKTEIETAKSISPLASSLLFILEHIIYIGVMHVALYSSPQIVDKIRIKMFEIADEWRDELRRLMREVKGFKMKKIEDRLLQFVQTMDEVCLAQINLVEERIRKFPNTPIRQTTRSFSSPVQTPMSTPLRAPLHTPIHNQMFGRIRTPMRGDGSRMNTPMQMPMGGVQSPMNTPMYGNRGPMNSPFPNTPYHGISRGGSMMTPGIQGSGFLSPSTPVRNTHYDAFGSSTPYRTPTRPSIYHSPSIRSPYNSSLYQ